MDDENRFWIAQQVAYTKNTADITPLFVNGKDVDGTRPNNPISDGAPKFAKSVERRSITIIS